MSPRTGTHSPISSLRRIIGCREPSMVVIITGTGSRLMYCVPIVFCVDTAIYDATRRLMKT